MSAMLLDAASLYFRAFHALPTSITDSKGRPVNAVRGFLDMLATLVRRFQPSHLVACLDYEWRPAWRVELVPSYKAHRVDTDHPGQELAPDELGPQVPVLLEVLDALGLAKLGVADHEADDVIATLTARLRSAMAVDVVTGDRDLFSLINAPDDSRHEVRVLYTSRGVNNLTPVNAAELMRRYEVTPSQYAEVAVLRGDSSDGLPGVPGIGEKTATRLITSFGSMAGVLAAIERRDPGVKPRQAISITEHADYIAAATRVTGVIRDLPVGDLDTAR
ncbi:MAG: 5'-3' exonuclease, partial [Mycobacteriales bacterium]